MMDSDPVRNMYSTLSNKFEKECISLAHIIRIHHDARSSECQIRVPSFTLLSQDITHLQVALKAVRVNFSEISVTR